MDDHQGIVLFGTRPEAIKLLTVIQEIRKKRGYNSIHVCCTGQHKDLIDDTQKSISLDVDANFQIMTSGQTPAEIVEKVLSFTSKEIEKIKPKWILVHGDTATTMGGALAGFHAQVDVIHLEAGLRTYDKTSPWPEEGIRQAVSKLADIHLAPTPLARDNLLSEKIDSKSIRIVGNPGADLLYADNEIIDVSMKNKDIYKKRILVTVHRRENQGKNLTEILDALVELSSKKSDVEILFVMHPNPIIQTQIHEHLKKYNMKGLADIKFSKPLPYAEFQKELRRSSLLLTDSGGLQEEAALLGIPCIIARKTTERPEIVDLGLAFMATLKASEILSLIIEMLDVELEREKIDAWRVLQGSGKAGKNTANAIMELFPT